MTRSETTAKEPLAMLESKPVKQASMVRHPYELTVYPDEGSGKWVARCAEIPACAVLGDSFEDAVCNVQDAIDAHLAYCRELKLEVPEPKRGDIREPPWMLRARDLLARMTPEERDRMWEAQRQSFARGNANIDRKGDRPEITREEVAGAADELLDEIGGKEKLS